MTFVNKLMEEQRSCEHCGTAFAVWSQGRHKRYCSKECNGKARRLAQRDEPESVQLERWKPAPPPELPESIDCPRCAKPMTLDLEMDREAKITGAQTRRWWCIAGHSHYYPPPITLPKTLMCGAHSQVLPCEQCQRMSENMKRLRATRGGNWNKGKHSGSIWATSA